MPFADEMIPPLRALTQKLFDYEMYLELSDVAALLAAFKSGNWPHLSTADQEFNLNRMMKTFHPRGMGESRVGQLPEYQFILDRIDSEFRAARRGREDGDPGRFST